MFHCSKPQRGGGLTQGTLGGTRVELIQAFHSDMGAVAGTGVGVDEPGAMYIRLLSWNCETVDEE